MKTTMNKLPARMDYSRDPNATGVVWNFYKKGEVHPIIKVSSDDPGWPDYAEHAARSFAMAGSMLLTLLDIDYVLRLVFSPGYEDFSFIRRIHEVMCAVTGVELSSLEHKGEVPTEPGTRSQMHALDNVLAHFLPAERADYEQRAEDADRDKHIFIDLRVLDGFLRHTTGITHL